MSRTRYIGKTIRFRVEGVPAGEPRPRFDSVRGRTYTEKGKAHAWKKLVRRAALDALGIPEPPEFPVVPAGTPVTVRIQMFFARPARHFRARDKRAGVLREDAPFLHATQPDADNLAKALIDALGPWPKGSAPILWQDDGLVSELHVEKRYTDLIPGAYVTIFSEAPLSVTSRMFLEEDRNRSHHPGAGSSRSGPDIGGLHTHTHPPDPASPPRLQLDTERTEP